MDKAWVNDEPFCEESDRATVIGESDEADTAVVPRPTDLTEVEVAQPLGLPAPRVNTVGWPLSQFGVSMVLIMELLKAMGFLAKMSQRREPLSAEEAFVVGVIETLDDAVAPRFTFRDETDLGSCVKTQAHHQAETAWVSVGTPEG